MATTALQSGDRLIVALVPEGDEAKRQEAREVLTAFAVRLALLGRAADRLAAERCDRGFWAPYDGGGSVEPTP